MGLPSGNRWAVSNLDADGPYFFQESPFQYECSFFSWGNVTPHNPINETEFDYSFAERQYVDSPGSSLTGDIPLTNDAARRILGRPWHMPTSPDFDELIKNCIFIDANGDEIATTVIDKRVTIRDVVGIYLQSKVNGARIFIACVGAGVNTGWNSPGVTGTYWSVSFQNERSALFLNIRQTGNVAPLFTGSRYYGRAIRPIWNPSDLRE